MASGKSTVGPLLAERAGVPLVDLDAAVEQRAGKPIAELFRSQGEAAFRKLERELLLAELEDPTPRVLAVGGGALMSRSIRLCALEATVVVTLDAPFEALRERAAGSTHRPLFDESARELFEARAAAYAEAHARVDATRPPAQVVDAVLDVWEREPVCVAAGLRSYSVDVGADIVVERAVAATQGATSVLLVSDINVAPLHASPVRAALEASGRRPTSLLLPAGEEHKTLGSLERVWQAAHDARLDRRGMVLALGGGVVTDIAGFAASGWLRGVRWAALPSTLLAMVDASVGGKTAVDFGVAKNAVGAFWQPGAVGL